MSSSTNNDSKPVAKPPAASNASSTFTNFATSGLGGMMGWVIVHPFNTLSVRMNLHSMASGQAGASTSFLSFTAGQIRDKGFMSLYNGLPAGLLRQVFYATSRFGLFEVFRDEMAKYRPTDIWSRLITGSVSGGIAALISCPCEVTLVRMSNDATLPPEQRRNYTSIANAFTRILSEEGPAAFFRCVLMAVCSHY
jgi:solute carrier family 25 oxoglutarate transporter 11